MRLGVFWLIRLAAFAVIGIVALVNPPSQSSDRTVQIACFSVVGVTLLAGLLLQELPRYQPRGLPVVLVVMAAAGGLDAVTSGGGQSLVAFAGVAAMAAAADLELPAAVAVAAAGIVPILIAGPIGGVGFGTLAGYPLLIVAGLLFGRNRRAYRVQAEQSAALLAQYEQLRAQQRRADVLDERTRI